MFPYQSVRLAFRVALPVIILALAACSGSDGSDNEQLMPSFAPTLESSAQVIDPPAESAPTFFYDDGPAVQQTPDTSNRQLLPSFTPALEPSPTTPGFEGVSGASNDVPPFLRDPSPSPTLPAGPTPTPTDITDSSIMAQYSADCPPPGDPLPQTVIERYYEFPLIEGDPLVITEYTWDDGEYRATEIQCSPDGDIITGEPQVIEDENRARIAQLVAEMTAPDYTPPEEDFNQPEISPVMESDGETIAVLGSAQRLEPVVEGQSVGISFYKDSIGFPNGLDTAFVEYDAYWAQVERILAEHNIAPESREARENIELCQPDSPDSFDPYASSECVAITSREISEFEAKINPERADPFVRIDSSLSIRGLDGAVAGKLVADLEAAGIYTSVYGEVNSREDENQALAVENARGIAGEVLQPQNQTPGEIVRVRVLYNPPNVPPSAGAEFPPADPSLPFADTYPPGPGEPFPSSPFGFEQPICPLSNDLPPEGRQWIFITTSTERITTFISRRILFGMPTFVETDCRDGSDVLYCPDPGAPTSGNVNLELIINADGRPVEAITAIDQPDFTGFASTLSRRRCVDPALYPRIFRSPNYPNDHMLVEVEFAIVDAGDQ